MSEYYRIDDVQYDRWYDQWALRSRSRASLADYIRTKLKAKSIDHLAISTSADCYIEFATNEDKLLYQLTYE